jgi:hypothetical protein
VSTSCFKLERKMNAHGMHRNTQNVKEMLEVPISLDE